jgi:hypothetical protein
MGNRQTKVHLSHYIGTTCFCFLCDFITNIRIDKLPVVYIEQYGLDIVFLGEVVLVIKSLNLVSTNRNNILIKRRHINGFDKSKRVCDGVQIR